MMSLWLWGHLPEGRAHPRWHELSQHSRCLPSSVNGAAFKAWRASSLESLAPERGVCAPSFAVFSPLTKAGGGFWGGVFPTGVVVARMPARVVWSEFSSQPGVSP